MTAVMGNGIGMKAVGPYTPLKFLRFWKANVGDEGTNAIVSYFVISNKFS